MDGRAWQVTRVRRNPWWLGLGASPLIVGAGLVAAARFFHVTEALSVAPHALTAAAAGLALTWAGNPRPLEKQGPLTIDADQVRFDGAVLAERDEIAGAAFHDDAGRTVVELKRRMRSTVSFVVADHAEARAIIHELGFDGAQHTATFKAASRISKVSSRWLFGAIFIGFASMLFLPTALGLGKHASLEPVGFGIFTLFAALFALLSTPTTIEVGVDAIATRWLGRREIIRLRDVERVSPTLVRDGKAAGSPSYPAVYLHLTDGTRRVVRMGWPVARRDALVAHLRAMLEMHRSGERAFDTSVLARGGRNASEWIRDLRAKGAGTEGGMRIAPVAPDRLWTVLEDPSADGLPRAAAAIALAPTATPDQRRRIRIAAGASADPLLRSALECAVEEEADEEALAEKLAALEKTQRE